MGESFKNNFQTASKAIFFDAKIIVMDEPTSSLTENEVENLFKIIEKLRDDGVSVIYISHKLNELFRISDRITVFRDGEYIATQNTKETTVPELVKFMVGRELNKFYNRSKHTIGETALEVRGLTKEHVLEDVSFNVCEGEIVGFAGLVGAGRSEIMRSIFGIDSYDSGDVSVFGQKTNIKSVKDAINCGLALIPEDRKKEGLVLKNDVLFNLTLSIQDTIKKGLKIFHEKRDSIVDKYVADLSIKTPSVYQKLINLSGGNQQKVVLAKWLATNPKILILDEPTRGIDVGAKAEIYSSIDHLARQGLAIVIVSSELPELINMCNRIYVLSEGKIMGELGQEKFSQEEIMHLATGGHQQC